MPRDRRADFPMSRLLQLEDTMACSRIRFARELPTDPVLTLVITGAVAPLVTCAAYRLMARD